MACWICECTDGTDSDLARDRRQRSASVEGRGPAIVGEHPEAVPRLAAGVLHAAAALTNVLAQAVDPALTGVRLVTGPQHTAEPRADEERSHNR